MDIFDLIKESEDYVIVSSDDQTTIHNCYAYCTCRVGSNGKDMSTLTKAINGESFQKLPFIGRIHKINLYHRKSKKLNKWYKSIYTIVESLDNGHLYSLRLNKNDETKFYNIKIVKDVKTAKILFGEK